MVRVFSSRYSGGLKPGMGEFISWGVGETVRVVAGQDEGRLFVITSESRTHAGCPGQYVREGYFAGDPARTLCAKREAEIWFDVPPVPLRRP